MKTKKQVRESFWNTLEEFFPELAKERRSRKKHNDYSVDIRVAFSDHVDYLIRSGIITESLANRVTL